MPVYERYYREPEYFGDPYPELIKFFTEYLPKGNVLDLGCGQGRGSTALARLGYTVTGVDISKTGIAYMQSLAEKENLNIKGIVADMYNYEIDENVDIVLLDSILHFYKPDKKKESQFLRRIMNEMRVGGLLCVLIWKSKKIENELENVLRKSITEWKTVLDKYINYPDKNMEMRMVAIIKK
jgi:2-polyprenyl-3-methyl-5-hydroxy-6-metoxy-1,4-benzoquinol methylase